MYIDMGYFYKQASCIIYTKQLFNYIQSHERSLFHGSSGGGAMDE